MTTAILAGLSDQCILVRTNLCSVRPLFYPMIPKFQQFVDKSSKKSRFHPLTALIYCLRVNQYEKETAETPLEEWMRYLKDGFIRPDTTVPGLQKARECLRVLSMSDQERKSYERYLYNKVYEEDVVETAREDGWFEGYDEGKAEEREIMIQKLRVLGFDDQLISEVTG